MKVKIVNIGFLNIFELLFFKLQKSIKFLSLK